MYSIQAEFASRAALRESLLDSFAEGGVFVAGQYDVTSGSPVMLRVSAPGLEPGVFVEGMVQWRRVGAQSPASGLSAGLGVRMLADQYERFQFMQRWAGGQSDDLQRLEWRFPYGSSVHIASEPRGTRQLLHTRFRDVSERGACVSTPTRLPAHGPMRVEFPLDGVIRAVSGHIVWATDLRAGIAIDADRGEDRAAWHQVLHHAESAFQAQIATLRPPAIRTSLRPGPMK